MIHYYPLLSIIVHYCPLQIIHWLMVEPYPSEKWWSKSQLGWWLFPIYIEKIWNNKTCSKPPTSTSPTMKTHNKKKNNMVDWCLDVSEVFLPGWCGKNCKPHDLSGFDILQSPIWFASCRCFCHPPIYCNHFIHHLNVPLFILHTTSIPIITT